jgi:hypothetical protein
MFPLSPLATGAFAVLIVAAVLTIFVQDRPERGWGWSALLLLSAIGVLMAARLSDFPA